MGDECLVLLAEFRPRDAHGLGRIRGLPARVRERRSQELFEAPPVARRRRRISPRGGSASPPG
jgi:hypothetical protein